MVGTIYLRFGTVPVNERSRLNLAVEVDWETESESYLSAGFTRDDATGRILEAGVSVFGLDANSCPEDEELIFDSSMYNKSWFDEYLNETPYLVSGVKVGRGYDGEPLIRDVKILGVAEVICVGHYRTIRVRRAKSGS